MSKNRSNQKIIEGLADLIRHHRKMYYSGKPEVTDKYFDAIEDRLRELDPENEALKEVGSQEVED